jgi:Ras-related protein Rab-1A
MNYIFKLLLIGDSGVGKSSIMLQYVDQTFTDTHVSTIGVDFKIITSTVNDKICKLQIWDTAGQERFKTITSSYYRGAHGIIVVYDTTNRESYDNVKIWLEEAHRLVSGDPNFILIGNKSDLSEKRKVSKEEAEEFATDNSIAFIETSAKTNVNVSNLFETLCVDMFRKKEKVILNEDMYKSYVLNEPNNTNFKCC